jgi:hypothetical protein
MLSGRVKDMKTAAIQIGPFVFSRIDYFFATSDDEFGRPSESHLASPRVDSPLSPNIEKWNAIWANWSEKIDIDSGELGDIGKKFLITFASKAVINLRHDW